MVMEPSSRLKYLLPSLLLLLFISGCLNSAAGPVPGNESDRLALLDFKSLITQDPLQILSSWNGSVHFCNWVGVFCNPSNSRVQILSLQSQRLSGSLPPSLGNLSYLTAINLRNNSFRGHVPPQIARLSRLQQINFTFNSFSGEFPSNLSTPDLTVLDLAGNNFSGQIPDSLASKSRLVWLDLGFNSLTGIVPRWLGNLSSLAVLSVGPNYLVGNVPDELGKLSRLGFFQLYDNSLTGTIPPAIYNISSLYYFSVVQNQLHGQLPTDVGLTLPNLRTFAGGVNNFTGEIPVSLANASGLQIIDFAQNGFTGKIPHSLGGLQGLTRLNFDQNRLGSYDIGGMDFLADSLFNCSNLVVLGLSRNKFGGTLSNSIANLSSQLQILTLGENQISGTIPDGIGNLVSLASLGLEGNYFTGSVPNSIGKLQQLEGLNLNYNRFSGQIPSSIGNLTRLTRLFMEVNRLEGSIPPSLGNCQNLQNLNISSNRLSGSIPREVMGLSSLSISLVLSSNFLTGGIPPQVGNLNNLMNLDLSGNKLTGEIPGTIGSCISLESLSLQGNDFQGKIPDSLKSLRGIKSLDLSGNNFSGNIPEFLTTLSSLAHLNLSENKFTGEVPSKGIFGNYSAFSIARNSRLCGGIQNLHLPSCTQEARQNKPTKSLNLKIVIPAILIAISAAVMAFCLAVILVRKRRKKERPSSARSLEVDLASEQDYQIGGLLSYSDLLKSTDGFAAENLVGSGSFGSVYKGALSDERTTVAVKVLNLQQQGASKSFLDECNALKNVRHRNLVKIMNVCSTVDRRGNEFKAIVFEFMPNGSLEDWLHHQDRARRLSLAQRLNIAIDVAAALEYLHHHCETPIAHCDLKPSNILLDQDLTARVGDFGLASFLFDGNQPLLSVSLKGSIGYIPPEYGQRGRVTVMGDVYSFGILILEMFTGKRPTDEMFKDDLSIHQFVAVALARGHVIDVVDASMLVDEEMINGGGDDDDDGCGREEEKGMMWAAAGTLSGKEKVGECLTEIMRVGLACSVTSSGNRIGMSVAVNKLQDIRDSLRR
ncbi:unnamed protein product [Linum tenue]|uniref:non-specific serine/threonine protein kinase n=1 Tax=Linum tenue TaxID=586396 RepID=A0AAV0KQ73_9ROSI|nr:unnamed protein product [Linum tenue]